MHLTIRHLDGRLEEAVILAISADRMRISIPNRDDVTELNLAQGVWMNEDHEPVEFEALVSGTDLSSVFAEIRPRVHTASYGVS